MVYIYALELQNGKYYIGRTSDLERRLDEHQHSNYSCAWVKEYPMVRVIEAYSNCDAFDEDKLVKVYMYRYGIRNVRGGAYTQVQLHEYQYRALKNELYSASGQCFRCGQAGHYLSNCQNNYNAEYQPLSNTQPMDIDDYFNL